MKTKHSLLLLLPLLAACHARPQPPTLPNTHPAPIAIKDPSPIPGINYSAFFNLTQEQAEYFQKYSNATRPTDRPIWFVFISSMRFNKSDRREFDGIIYFAPDRQTQQLREGRYMRITFLTPKLQQMRADPNTTPQQLAIISKGPKVDTYIHIPNQPATPVPTIKDLPIPKPPDLTDDELVKVVLAARAAYARLEQRQDAAILSVSREGKDFIVRIGVDNGPLSGRGVILTIHPPVYDVDPNIGGWEN